jgi:hypothetical protein
MSNKNMLSLVLAMFITISSLTVNAINIKDTDRALLQQNNKNQIANHLKARLYRIELMNKSRLNKTELNQLLKEVKEIKKQSRPIDGGIFISAGALIVILIVLLFLI